MMNELDKKGAILDYPMGGVDSIKQALVSGGWRSTVVNFDSTAVSSECCWKMVDGGNGATCTGVVTDGTIESVVQRTIVEQDSVR
jgi:hypothetical protein